MSKFEIDTSTTTPITALEAAGNWIVDEGVTVLTPGTALIATGTATARTFDIHGTLSSVSGPAVDFGTEGADTTGNRITIGDTGKVQSGGLGVVISSGGLSLVNEGEISAKQIAVVATATVAITNSGMISSGSGPGVSASGFGSLITNHGTIDALGDTLVFTGNATIATNNGLINASKGSAILSSADSAIFTNNGTVKAVLTALSISGDDATLTNNGLLQSALDRAVVITGDDAILTNNGTISAKRAGITVTGDHVTLTNDGGIDTKSVAIVIVADHAVMRNNQTIAAGGVVSVKGMDAALDNYGTLKGTLSARATVDFFKATASTVQNHGLIEAVKTAVLGGAGSQSVINSGTIKGNVTLGSGNDYLENLTGSITGTVSGGAGNDVYVIGNAGLKLFEVRGGGNDLVKASTTFTLAANFEQLTLFGAKAIDGTGNAGANRIEGNGAANRLDGGAGKDILVGNRGNDTLHGGTGVDTFVFATGHGRDKIEDFKAKGIAHDVIDLSGMNSITSFADLKAHHMKASSTGVLIDGLKGDTILLEDVALKDLDAGDFWF